jgi:hypothetical protein
MMHQENWMATMMMNEQKRNELVQEANNSRLINCCKNSKPVSNKILVPLFKHFQMENTFSKPAIQDLID